MRLTSFFMLVSFPLVAFSVGCGSDDSEVTSNPGPADAGADAPQDVVSEVVGEAGEAGHDAATPDPICLSPGAGPYSLVFTDVTAEIGLGPEALNATGSNVTVADVDGDHWPDLVLSLGQSTRDDPADPKNRYRLLRNEGGSSFEDVTWTSGLFDTRDGTPGRATTFVLFGDFDNDGDADALSAVYEDADKDGLEDHTSLMLNDGTGKFTHGPQQSFTSGAYDPLASAAILDYDRDGLLDVWTGHHYGQYGYLSSTIQDSLFRGDGAGGFTDVTNDVGLTTQPFSTATVNDGKTHKPTWGVAACDIDGDGWTELLAVSYGRQFNALYRNVQGVFEDHSLSSGFAHDDDEDYSKNIMYMC